MPEFTADERDALADALKRITTRFDNLFETSFPYTMGFHQSPTDGRSIPSGTSTRTSIRRCCARPRCASSWWVLKCWACRSATSRRRAPRERLRACSEVHFWPRELIRRQAIEARIWSMQLGSKLGKAMCATPATGLRSTGRWVW